MSITKNSTSEIIVPKNSPWGEVQSCENLHPDLYGKGVFQVSCAGHGGIAVHKSGGCNLSSAAKSCGISMGKYYFFEEDCDFAIVLYELKIPGYKDHIKNLLRYNPNYCVESGLHRDEEVAEEIKEFNKIHRNI